jgi:hypothetical protein
LNVGGKIPSVGAFALSSNQHFAKKASSTGIKDIIINACTTFTSHSRCTTSRRFLSTTTPRPPTSLEGYYHIEASNSLEDEGDVVYATRLTGEWSVNECCVNSREKKKRSNNHAHEATTSLPCIWILVSLFSLQTIPSSVTGPDVDGILASMTVALAVKGCSLVSLHAAKVQDTGYRKGDLANNSNSTNERVSYSEDDATPPDKDSDSNTIKDVFYVVNRFSGEPFQDDELYDLAESLLEALKTPMAIMGGTGAIGSHTNKNATNSNNNNTVERVISKQPTPPYPTRNEQITVITSDGSTVTSNQKP